MAEMPQIQSSRACRCLNVRIWSLPHQEKPPDFLIAGDSEYALAYVGDEGISISHPQVTMRTRRIGPPIAASSRCVRFTTLTCLLCQTAAYRVLQLVASGEDVQEGSLLPSFDWVEQETLMSSCGWIEVHKDCLLTEDITQLSSSSAYSSTFGIALPQKAIPVLTSTQPTHQDHGAQTNNSVGPFFYDLKPLFPPAPFVSSHPVFAYLSSVAVKASEHLRSLAEEQVAAIVRDKFAELEKADDELRQKVEGLWQNFFENLGEVEKQMGPSVDEPRRRDNSRGFSLSTSTPLVSVREFMPKPNTAPRMMSPSSSRSKVSSLSASLAASAFHHVRLSQELADTRERLLSRSPPSPPPYSSHPSSLDSADDRTSSSLESSPKLSPLVNGDTIMQPFKRSMDETRDTAVSFRYFTILEADVARARQQQQQTSQPGAESEGDPVTGEPTEGTSDSNATKAATSAKEAEEIPTDPPESSDRDAVPPTGGTTRRRKVKFDIGKDKEVALTGDATNPSANGESRENEGEELLFDFEEASSDPESSDAAPTLPFIESAQARRRGRSRVANAGALPASLSSLRPASLPAYSALRSKDAEAAAITNRGASTTTPVLLQEAREYPGEFDPQEEEILRLVAANTPSHRSAWRRNSKAWQLFVSRRRHGVPGALIPEETDDGSGRVADDTDDSDWGTSRDVRWSLGNAGFAASLPIDISPITREREPLSLASYQPKTSLADRAGMVVPVFPDGRRHSSSATMRRASYAERDRSRAMDPGALDFIAGDREEAEDDESDEESIKANIADEARGRHRALKILQARSKLPEASMWMSLA